MVKVDFKMLLQVYALSDLQTFVYNIKIFYKERTYLLNEMSVLWSNVFKVDL